MTTTISSVDTLVRGLANPVYDAQTCFRVLLDALSRPGRVGSIDVSLDEGATQRWPAAAFAAMLTIMDYTTPVWMQEQDEDLAQAIRFHTGAQFVATPDEAVFGYINNAAVMPDLDSFVTGTPEAPQDSITLLIRVDSFEGGERVTLSGPGIKSTTDIAPRGLPGMFWEQRAAFDSIAPRGLDCYFFCERSVIGIPRTTKVEVK